MPKKKDYPKWFNVHYPPREPAKPVEPQPTHRVPQNEPIMWQSAKTVGELRALLAGYDDNQALGHTDYNDCSIVEGLEAIRYVEVPNPNYEYGLKLYKKGLELYQKEFETYQEQKKLWEELKERWDTEEYNEKYAKLSKELAALEKWKVKKDKVSNGIIPSG